MECSFNYTRLIIFEVMNLKVTTSSIAFTSKNSRRNVLKLN